MHIWKSLANLGVGVVSAILLVTAVVVLSLTRAFSSGMIGIKPQFFIQMAATIIVIIALWKLFAGDRVVATRLGAMAMAGFLLANVPLKLPGTWSLGEAAISEADYENARRADALLVAKAVPCDPPHFKVDGSPRYWWSPREDGICYDRDGKGLSPVNAEEMFDMLARQRAKAKHIEVVVAVPSPVPSPVVVASVPEAIPVQVPQPQPTNGPPPGDPPASAVPVPTPQVVVARQPQPIQRISARPMRPDTQ